MGPDLEDAIKAGQLAAREALEGKPEQIKRHRSGEKHREKQVVKALTGLTIPATESCPHCKGDGTYGDENCAACAGTGLLALALNMEDLKERLHEA